VSGVIDTNLLLYAANSDAAEHRPAREFLSGIGSGRDPWYLTDGILYEFMRVATHAKVFPRPLDWHEAFGFIEPICKAGNVYILNAGHTHWPLLGEILATLTHPSGNIFFDIRTVVLMREHGIRRIYTTDTDFLQFGDIEVLNPLRS
jgi:toxin-antitoxin system PIN domain toxin